MQDLGDLQFVALPRPCGDLQPREYGRHQQEAQLAEVRYTSFKSMNRELTEDRVAPGRRRPGAPTDPYVPALEHTVPQIMVSLRA